MPKKGHFFTTKDKSEIYYIDKGTGKALLFVHGWGANLKTFEDPIEELSKNGYRCIAADQRGHGKSKATSGFTVAQSAADIHALIEYLALEEVILIGWSMGGAVLFSYIEQFGCQYLNKMIIADMTPRLLNDSSWNLGLYKGVYTKEMLLEDKALQHDHFNTFYGNFIYHVNRTTAEPYQKAPFYYSFISRGLRLLQPVDPKPLWIYWNSLAKADYRKVMSRILVPTAVFYPSPGSIFAPEAAAYIAENIPGKATLVEFKNAGHLFVIEQKKEFIEAIETFIKES